MRTEFEKILGEESRYLAIETRDRLDLTQRKMGMHLEMCESSYSDIETGHTTCGALSLVLLLSMQDDPKAFLNKVTAKFAKCYEEQMRGIS